MRVIAGSARSLRLQTPSGSDVRPTTDRIKETLFNILSPSLYDCDFLDIFAGSGGIGIEALSRGAGSAVFIENAAPSLACINANLEHTGLKDRATVLRSDAVLGIERLFSLGRRFDIIFMDPPYGRLLEKQVLECILAHPILKEEGIIVAEALADTDFEYLNGTDLRVYREKCYGSNKHVFIRAEYDAKL